MVGYGMPSCDYVLSLWYTLKELKKEAILTQKESAIAAVVLLSILPLIILSP
jgi:hypothetical protein